MTSIVNKPTKSKTNNDHTTHSHDDSIGDVANLENTRGGG